MKKITFLECLKYGEIDLMEYCQFGNEGNDVDVVKDLSEMLPYNDDMFLERLSEHEDYVAYIISFFMNNRLTDKLNILGSLLKKLKYSLDYSKFIEFIHLASNKHENGRNFQMKFIHEIEKYIKNNIGPYYDINDAHVIDYKIILGMLDDGYEKLLKYLQYNVCIYDDPLYDTNEDDIKKVSKYRKFIFIFDNLKNLDKLRRLSKIIKFKFYNDSYRLIFDIFVDKALSGTYANITNEYFFCETVHKYYVSEEHSFAKYELAKFITYYYQNHLQIKIDNPNNVDFMDIIELAADIAEKKKFILKLLNSEDVMKNKKSYIKIMNITDKYFKLGDNFKKCHGIILPPNIKLYNFKNNDAQMTYE